jgi:HEAT repeat protein
MKNLTQRNFIGAVILAAVFAAGSISLHAGTPKSEEVLIADLASPKEKTVISAMQEIEKNYPDSVKAQTEIKKLLSDARQPVMRKAARVLGVVHAEVSGDDLKKIAELLKSTDKAVVIDGLKSLRGLKAQSTIPEILPLLKNSNPNIVRDACRTLAVLGDKSLIPSIKPLLEVPDLAVQKDAADAIAILKEK